jgi:hypothetical protein
VKAIAWVAWLCVAYLAVLAALVAWRPAAGISLAMAVVCLCGWRERRRHRA